MPTAPGESLPPPIRARARAAVDRAWDRAMDAGSLPALPPDERPAVEIERPAKAEHGDFATNLAMRLARPYRRAPLEIAGSLRTRSVVSQRSAPPSSPIAAAEAARRASSTSG